MTAPALRSDLSRGRLLIAVAVTVALSAVAFGCGDDPGSDAATTSTSNADGVTATTLPEPDEPLGPGDFDLDPAPACKALAHGERRAGLRLLGTELERAEELLEATPCSLRVVERDGKSLPVTDDYTPNRINVAVRGGVIAAVKGLG